MVDEHAGPGSAWLSEPPRRRRRLLALAILVVGTALAVVAVLSVAQALDARDALQRGRERAVEARDLLTEGAPQRSARSFRGARDSFTDARARLSDLPLGIVRSLPFLGDTPRAMGAIADAGSRLASGGAAIADAVAGMPRGMASLGPRDGRIDARAFAALGPAVGRAADDARAAAATVRGSPAGLLLGPVREARADALREVEALERSLRSADALIARLPQLLGEDRPARYFVAAQNPAELRGTGGLMGAYSVLTVNDGRFRFRPFRPIQELRNVPRGRIEPPNPDYAEHYDRFGGAGFWVNMNMTPDFPSVAEAIHEAYERVEGVAVDGVIATDPFALEAMLEHTGAVDVPRFEEVEAETVVEFVTNRAYRLFADNRARKAVLGDVALEVLRAFLHEAEGGATWVRALGDAGGGGHLLVWSAEPEIQTALRRAGVSGELDPASENYLSVVQNNGAGNKVDFYLRRTVSTTVRLQRDGSAETTVRVLLENEAPSEGPRYVIGPHPGVSEAGENVAYVSVYCGARCVLRSAERDGERIAVYGGTELGVRFYQDHLRIPSGGRVELRMDLAIEDAWNDEGRGPTYRLTFADQPTVHPTRLHVRVLPPPGMGIRSVGEGMRKEDGHATWEGDPGRLERLEVDLG